MMNYQSYLEKMKNIQKLLLDYIGKEDNLEENYQNLTNYFNDSKVGENMHELDSTLRLILNVANNHHRSNDFFSKIEKIILIFKNEIKQSYSNFDIFNIFKSNKRILLFLIEEKIMKMDKTIASIINKGIYKESKYPNYFLPEIKKFIDHETFQKISKDFPEDYEEKRKIGENETLVCELIRNDLIDDFIKYVKKNHLNVNTKIDQSIFETNSFLIKKYMKSFKTLKFACSSDNVTLIEYSAFFSSTQIFKYLIKNAAEVEQSIWLFAIHSKNPEIIQALQENEIERKHCISEKCYSESIKCHYNDIGCYVQENFLEKKPIKSFDTFAKCIKYFNFNLFNEYKITNTAFYNFCKYNHCSIVEILLNEKSIDVNAINQILLLTFFI